MLGEDDFPLLLLPHRAAAGRRSQGLRLGVPSPWSGHGGTVGRVAPWAGCQTRDGPEWDGHRAGPTAMPDGKLCQIMESQNVLGCMGP